MHRSRAFSAGCHFQLWHPYLSLNACLHWQKHTGTSESNPFDSKTHNSSHWFVQFNPLNVAKRLSLSDRVRSTLTRKRSQKEETLYAERELSFDFQGTNKQLSKTIGHQIKSLPHSGTLNKLFIKVGKPSSGKCAPRDAGTKPTLSCDTLLFSLQRKVSWVPQRQCVEYGIFFGTNSTAAHQLIEPGSQRGAQYRTLFLFLHLSY